MIAHGIRLHPGQPPARPSPLPSLLIKSCRSLARREESGASACLLPLQDSVIRIVRAPGPWRICD